MKEKHEGHHMGAKHGGGKHHGMGKKEMGFGAKLGKEHGKGHMGKGIEGPHGKK
jgi:hypothetical protein